MAWTPIAKPGAQSYTNVNLVGKEQYDQASISYDDASIFYDGLNPNQWTEVAKPQIVIGSLMWSEAFMAWEDADQAWEGSGSWTKVAKPT